MRSASIAEWILGRFTSRGRAASTVGDLLEASDHRGIVPFWISVAAILLSLAWRRSLAFAAALCLGIFSLAALHNFIDGLDVAHRPPHELIGLFGSLEVIGVLLSFGMPYTAIRYGLRDPFSRQVLTFWGLASILILYWWIPMAPAACAVLCTSSIVYSAMSASRRRASVAFVMALGLSFVVAALLSRYLTTWLYNISAVSALSRTSWMALKRLAFTTFWFGWIIQPYIYSRVHRIFFGDKSCDGAEQATA